MLVFPNYASPICASTIVRAKYPTPEKKTGGGGVGCDYTWATQITAYEMVQHFTVHDNPPSAVQGNFIASMTLIPLSPNSCVLAIPVPDISLGLGSRERLGNHPVHIRTVDKV